MSEGLRAKCTIGSILTGEVKDGVKCILSQFYNQTELAANVQTPLFNQNDFKHSIAIFDKFISYLFLEWSHIEMDFI